MTDKSEAERYQEWTEETAMGHATSETEGISQEDAAVFLSLALNGESGEIAEKAKRVLRGDGDLAAVEDEIGDVLWYLARLADELDVSLSTVMEDNMEKLEDRKERGVIAGSGDDR